MNELVVKEALPPRLIVPTEDLLSAFNYALMGYGQVLPRADLIEIITQIGDAMVNADEGEGLLKFVEAFRSLPLLDRIASRSYFLETLERQHVLKAATQTLAASLFRRLEQLGAFQAPGKKGTFPYIVAGLEGNDVMFTVLPF